ncbi:histidine triad nucleotide-binding protein [Candidatus Giovannonibacteria bacterium RIFCSPLOWO2_02_FULL_43_11b]|uniref:Histidine triad nucleotide-binding protein n=1 Tax=Candidatus Giovannonibacteria bacterium RIFCSPHIGHO2_12_FULL_43_15 TaxID=1798341 RepID=A0A1F5WQP9_9BACT|nr:MAG: histidine triad nucleotide-binding protein [Candidatus Giovannonibacteria bacterium RIFCSPHIGHO2_02_FULL_43_32]OGF77940.1 MAG: histidine triad nucleotide-binding protein [Candidatus Giovannonibacteria bacterium RIFCSPHIGHO2_12_FULL_43_15]OGF78285.1 MAG: histidine triad nucleotide-binding protein [Candidatus Giovannonibacteria bacterium RIFCSPLOWO2_01_FULL_43_60]OGF90284.1 MAG: histidine triad nucleotide-binding protein [Candidatus Giovannonibacteria bacterium RIFCSPLOWO2_02_FULL_43_11b]
MESCIFCKIANKEIPKEFALENEELMAFDDIHPKAPIHILIVTKAHVASIKELESPELAGDMIMAARELAREKKLDGYRLMFNVGREGGQEIDHLHLHLMGGK